ncbi:MAG: hypothetical protein E6614_27750 [Bradyrhizobium sp.]|uniref:Uncharacterized protein n=2 Tax=Bradyrhizobium TaxID=374 RepID=A0ABS5GBX0_9BRAD|nr:MULTISPECIES: hypothetical protein [Bradyrhizobium]MBR1138106.1 hypothetical protein [Bradyrhizobium denitrificans]MDU0955631.1 hypothetical protein [Bradyrhizobium sp.]MDU1493627.1 hypothetical protein [Bradyrhizobium sp.]MDU1543922.1 hypothetical protein [Bradyrhizobium sp.]MDU1689325.1 hypothetical protein [Bradyrhizobium sp.]
MVRGMIGAGILLLAMGSGVQAANEAGPDTRMSCSEVRYYVEKYTAEVAEMYARSRGVTDAQINRARRCLSTNHFRRADRSRSYTE